MGNIDITNDAYRKPVADLFNIDHEYRKRLERANRFIRKI